MYKNISSIMGSSMVSRFVNINVAKAISCVLLTMLLVVNGFRWIHSGGNSCQVILSKGTLLDKYAGVWQPHGCMLHTYKPTEAHNCLQKKNIAFVGDSRIRELMFSFFGKIKPSFIAPTDKIHSDIHLKENDINVSFYWAPELNTTVEKIYKSWMEKPTEAPSIVFQAAATHTIKRMNASDQAFLEYTRNFTTYLKIFQQYMQEHASRIFWILQEPVAEDKLHPARKMITNKELERYNDAIEDILSSQPEENGVKTIKAFKEMAYQLIDLSPDGLHLPSQALNIESNILINYLCNGKNRPVDGTCCQSAPGVTPVQLLLFLIGIACIVGAVVMAYLQHQQVDKSTADTETGDIVANGKLETAEPLIGHKAEPIKKKEKTKAEEVAELVTALAKFSAILLYFYICDRTNLFMKGNKHFTSGHFFLPLLYITLLGIFGIVQTSQTALLNRDQTDEWKGWMQLVILIYHMSGASVNVPIYMHIRILVAMYLFMTGYGHFSYFWHISDYSLYRVTNVVFRLNLLTVSLCLVMDRSYQFYYFVPLCTFWFLVLYISMAVWPRANLSMLKQTNGANSPEVSTNGEERNYPLKSLNLRSPYAVMSLKLILLFLGISILFVSESYFEALFSWWPAIRLFELPVGMVREWWFRCQLDRYAMLHGAVLCFIYIIMKKLSILDDSKQGCLFSMKTSFITMTFSISIVIVYTVWLVQCTDKPSCNHVHSYASIFPITAFIIIRNVPGYLRSGYSAFFAWFGKISLELFIGQYHIWLAADTKGMLVLVSPEWPTLNLVITTFIFVCVAHEINVITGVLTKHVVGGPKDNYTQTLLRCACVIAAFFAISFIQNNFSPPNQVTG